MNCMENLWNGNIKEVQNILKDNFVNKTVDKFLNFPIHIACKKGLTDIAKLLLQHKSNIESENNEKCRPIHCASINGHVKIIKLLLQYNCNIECEDNWKRRPITYACINGHIEIVKLLLQYNCNIECDDNEQDRPIHYASINGNAKIVKLLLQHNCNLECEDKWRHRPIHYASINGHVEILKLLLQYNCNIECEDNEQNRSIHYAIMKEHVEIVKLLLQKNCNIECENNEKRRPIHYASITGHVEIVKLLLQNNCNIECEDNNNRRPISYAIMNEHVEIVKLLLQKKCNIECEDEKRRAIFYGSEKGHIEVMKLLLQHNCNIECEDNEKRRPINYAIMNEHVEIVKLLLQHNCNIECEDINLQRPVHYACINGYVEIVKLLLQHNCNVECQDNKNRRPIYYAIINEHVEIVKLLLQKNCNIECEDNKQRRPIHYASEKGHVEIMKLLLQHNCNFECEDNELQRPLHYACIYGHFKIVILLLEYNCYVNCKDKTQHIPVQYAELYGHVGILKLLRNRFMLQYSPIDFAERHYNRNRMSNMNGIKLLIACKNGILTNLPSLLNAADIEYCDQDNRRPIHWACQYGHIEIVKLLIERNCNIDARDNFNLCPMTIAENNKNEELINILASEILDRHQLKQQISRMGLICKSDCDHKLCPKSLKDKTFYKGLNIGNGAYGEVFRCKGSGTDREFAMKRIKLNQIHAKSIEGNINKFQSELNHVRIVKYFGIIQTAKHLCIFMELLHGGSLEDKIKTEKFIKPENIIIYCKQILEGLEFLHGNKIIHRDLKPANILMDNDNNIKLADFGIGRSLIRTDGKLIDAKTFIGTPNFMAPEVMNNESYNVHADIWSLGATMINMITSKPPYYNINDPAALICEMASTKKLALPQSPLISNEMKIFIESMLNPDPNSRPSATELLKSNLFSQ